MGALATGRGGGCGVAVESASVSLSACAMGAVKSNTNRTMMRSMGPLFLLRAGMCAFDEPFGGERASVELTRRGLTEELTIQ